MKTIILTILITLGGGYAAEARLTSTDPAKPGIQATLDYLKERCAKESGTWMDFPHDGVRVVGCVWTLPQSK